MLTEPDWKQQISTHSPDMQQRGRNEGRAICTVPPATEEFIRIQITPHTNGSSKPLDIKSSLLMDHKKA